MRTDWTEEYQELQVSEPYLTTVSSVADMFAQLSGDEASLPDRLAQIMFDLGGRGEPPLRLLIGRDAVELADHAAKRLLASDQKWLKVSESSGKPKQ